MISLAIEIGSGLYASGAFSYYCKGVKELHYSNELTRVENQPKIAADLANYEGLVRKYEEEMEEWREWKSKTDSIMQSTKHEWHVEPYITKYYHRALEEKRIKPHFPKPNEPTLPKSLVEPSNYTKKRLVESVVFPIHYFVSRSARIGTSKAAKEIRERIATQENLKMLLTASKDDPSTVEAVKSYATANQLDLG